MFQGAWPEVVSVRAAPHSSLCDSGLIHYLGKAWRNGEVLF